MSGPVIIAQLAKNRHETVRVALDRYGGVNLIDIRICVELTDSSGIQTPTKKGVAIRVEQLPDLVEALRDAEAKARALGLLR